VGKKLFVGGLAWATTDESLRGAFDRFGHVVDAKVILDRETGRSRGFGFVSFREDREAADAMARMDGAELDGRTIRVSEADDKGRGASRPSPRRDDRDSRWDGGRSWSKPTSEPSPSKPGASHSKPRSESPDRMFVDRSDVTEPPSSRDRDDGGRRPASRPARRGGRSGHDDSDVW
jgi:cold-inducible RNA-binding protein